MSEINRILGENLRILTQAMRDICQRSTLEEASEGLLTANQFSILTTLNKKNDLTAQDFARVLGISGAAVSKNIDSLVTMELVERQPNPDDRRSMALQILPAGYQLLENHDKIYGRKLDYLLADYNTEQKHNLLSHLQHLIQMTLSGEQDVDQICYQCGGYCGDSCVIEERRGSCTLKRRGE